MIERRLPITGKGINLKYGLIKINLLQQGNLLYLSQNDRTQKIQLLPDVKLVINLESGIVVERRGNRMFVIWESGQVLVSNEPN